MVAGVNTQLRIMVPSSVEGGKCHRRRDWRGTFKSTYFYLFIWLHRVFCGMWDLVPPPGIEPRASALRAQSLSHWTTRGVPENFLELTLLFIENTNQVLLHLYTLPVPVVVFNWSLQLNTTQNNLILTQKPKDCTSPSIYKIIKP